MRTRLQRSLGKATEPQILFPVLGSLALLALWGTTLVFVSTARSSAERSALATTRELVGTYEAQVVRALREIDLTLKVVKYAYETQPGRAALPELRQRALLPPELLFVVSIADPDGDIVASTRPLAVTNVADREYFQTQRLGDELAIGLPRQDADTGEWTLRFSRRLESKGGSFAGVVMLSVGADFFVSGYEQEKLGRSGVLGILGTDAVFRARRTGDSVSYGDEVDYASAAPGADQEEVRVSVGVSPWDGVSRFTGAHQLYDLPLTVVVGLSRAEHLADANREAGIYVRRAAAGSVVLILVVALFGRLSWQLAESRRRAVAEQVAHAQQVEYLAYHDPLTGLANRSFFSKLLHQGLQQARRADSQLAVLFLDLDRFKHINDTLGHEAGDQLLREVARRLKSCLRDSDVVARLGGDEFVVMLPTLPAETHAATVAQKVLSALAKPFVLLSQEFRVTGSVGIAVHPRDGLDEQTLTKNADIAMYKAKEQGKNNFQFYSEQMNAESLERLALEASLRHAVERGEFELHYQAKRDLKTGGITGMEALLRWRHPDLGTVAPMRFLPVAEQTGLIVPIGKWVLRTACAQNVAWQREGLPRLGMAVNLTPLQFLDAHLLSDVAEILESTGMEARLLELEITEHMLMHDVERTLRILSGLKEMGVRVAVDDFGVGYTAISTLQQFPLDTIKIDRSFIREVAHVAEDSDLAEAIIAMGKSLSLTVVAQGVETREQAEFLREHACDELQGFYFNRPVAAAEFREILRAQANAPAVADLAAHWTKRRA